MSESLGNMSSRDADALHRMVLALLPEYEEEPLLAAAVRDEVAGHLRVCAACARELQVGRAVRDRLQRQDAPPVPAGLRARISAAVAATPSPTPRLAEARSPATWSGASRQTLVRWSGWAVAAGLILVLMSGGPPAPADMAVRERVAGAGRPAIPMVQGMVADYAARLARRLPGDERGLSAVIDSVPFAVQPLSGAGTQVIGAWTTIVRGEPAAVIAYRWKDRVVVQYVVSDSLFFHHPDVRSAVATRGLYSTKSGALGIVGWPGAGSGSVVVGALTPEELARLRS